MRKLSLICWLRFRWIGRSPFRRSVCRLFVRSVLWPLLFVQLKFVRSFARSVFVCSLFFFRSFVRLLVRAALVRSFHFCSTTAVSGYMFHASLSTVNTVLKTLKSMAHLVIECAVVCNGKGSLPSLFYIVQEIQHCRVPAKNHINRTTLRKSTANFSLQLLQCCQGVQPDKGIKKKHEQGENASERFSIWVS